MAKYMSTVFYSILTIPNRALTVVLNSKYSSNPECCKDNNSDHHIFEQNRQRLLKVAIVGVPNAGKSSLINSIVQRSICPYSCKVHTTKSSARAIQSVGDTQLVFLDTPGLVDSKEIKKYNLDRTFANDSVNAIEEADIIGVIHDVSNRYTRNRLDPKVLRLLHLYPNKDSFLILNKIDLLRSKIYLLDLARSLTCLKHEHFHIPKPYIMTPKERKDHKHSKIQERMLGEKIKDSVGWEKFNDVFMVSAVFNHGTSDIKEYLLQKSKPSPWIFPDNIISDKEDHELVQRIIESRLYDDLPNEVPYNLKIELEYYEISREGNFIYLKTKVNAITDVLKQIYAIYQQLEFGNIHAVVLIHCNTPRIEKLVMGKRGQRIRDIAKKSEQSLRNVFMTDVFLKLVVTNKLKSFIQPKA